MIPQAALVTGGAKRLGRAAALALADAGFAVAVHCNGSVAEAEATAAEVRDAVFKVRDTIGKTEAVTLIKKVAGVEKLGEVKPAKYAALISACTDALDALGAEGEGPAVDDI